jgi:hypothetical protein
MTKHQSEPNAQPASEPATCAVCPWCDYRLPLPGRDYEYCPRCIKSFSFRKPIEPPPASEPSGMEESLNSLEARLAADIRAIDGNHDKGAAELAEQLIARGWHPAPAGEREAKTLESINALVREFGFGQGELDDDLAGCLRRAVDGQAERFKALEASNAALQVKLNAVAGLVEKWRGWSRGIGKSPVAAQWAYTRCADELEAALE